ncbi:MAG: AMP-binding enzyme [Woeseiaceae bacterium]
MKEIIISDGFNILAIDLEKVLLEHPDITAAAVIGGPSEQRGEIPVAFVEVWGPVGFNADAAKSWVNARLSQQEQIYEIHVIEQLPRSQMGEVLKRELRDQLT